MIVWYWIHTELFDVCFPSSGEKFSELDAAFQARERSLGARSPSGTSVSAAEERMLRYEREVQARAQQQIKLEVARFRELEAQQIRTQEFDKYRKQVDQLVRDVRDETPIVAFNRFHVNVFKSWNS